MVDACDLCGSTRFYIEDGLRYCSNGHEQGDGQQIAEADDEFAIQGKRTKRKKVKAPVKTSKIYRGHRAYKLFLQAYQHILWRQCYALIHKKDLPAELWTVVRDLWTLRLARQADRLEKSSTPEGSRLSVSTTAGPSEDESDGETQSELQTSGKKASDSPVLIETVALCYLGVLLMRLPVSIGDIYRWIRSEDIPYFRAIRQVPPEMVTHLPGEYQRALDTETILQPDGLQTAIYRLCTLYTAEFSMSLPALNAPPLLFQYMKQLALPLEIYPAVKNLNQIVNFTFKYSPTSSATIRRNATSHPEAQLMSLVVVATKLLFPFDSDVVRRYPRSLNEPAAQRLDWKKWAELQKQATPLAHITSPGRTEDATPSKPPLQKGREVEVTDTDIFEMSGAELDEYMDWYQRTWIESAKNGSADDNPNKEIQAMFPLTPLPAEDPQWDPEREIEQSRLSVVQEVHAAMKINRVVSDEDGQLLQRQKEMEGGVAIKRPGDVYRLYMRVGDLQPETARAFYDAAAEAACMSVEKLAKAVRQTETKLEVWKRERRRTERLGRQEDTGDTGDGDGDDEEDDEEDDAENVGTEMIP